MNKHRKDHQALYEAYNQIQQVDEKGGFWDKTLAKSPIMSKLAPGMSARAGQRVGSKGDANTMIQQFNSTLGGQGKDVDAEQFKGWLQKSTRVDPNSLPEVQSLQGRIPNKQILKMIPKLVDDMRAIKMSGRGAAQPAGEPEDPNSVYGPDGQQEPPTNTNPPGGGNPAGGGESVEELKAQIEQLKAQLAATQQGGGDGDGSGPPAGGEPPQFNPGDKVTWGPGTIGDVISVNAAEGNAQIKNSNNRTFTVTLDKLQLA